MHDVPALQPWSELREHVRLRPRVLDNPDPILYELPFERFLNPDRVTMPDIDLDFEDARRAEVISYVSRKYGTDQAQIITFGTMLHGDDGSPRAALSVRRNSRRRPVADQLVIPP
jgi:hypothetical protein